MILVHSYFNNKFHNKFRFQKDLYAQATLSVKFLKKHGYTVVLFTDDSPLLNIPYYDDIKQIDIQEYNLPANFWSAGKLISCLSLNKPYIHIDMDLFLIENVISDYLQRDFFCLHNEPQIAQMFSAMILNISDYIIQKISLDTKNIVCKNMSIFGGNDQKINPLIRNVLDIAENNSKEINSALANPLAAQHNDNGNSWKHSVFYEQILLTNSLKIKPDLIYNFPQDYNHVKQHKALKDSGVDHLWFAKGYIEKVVGISNYLKKLEKDFL